MTLWLWLAAPFIGLLLGLFGAGGGMLMVPLLSYGLGLPIKEAIATSLWIVAAVSLIAATQQRAWKVLKYKLLLFFAGGGILGGAFGAWVGTWISDWIQQALFSVLLLLVALWMARAHRPKQAIDKPCNCGLALLVGLLLGIITGLLGVGGGFLMVPALLLLGISNMRTAVVHSLVLIACNASISGIIYLDHISLSPQLIISISLIAGLGSLLGSHLLLRISKTRLQQAFSTGLAVLGVAMLGQLIFKEALKISV